MLIVILIITIINDEFVTDLLCNMVFYVLNAVGMVGHSLLFYRLITLSEKGKTSILLPSKSLVVDLLCYIVICS